MYHIWKKNGKATKLSPYFYNSEFSCPCQFPTCIDQKISADLVAKLTEIREKIGFSLIVTSGYRCPEYQAHLKSRGFETAIGVSQHELGNAADVAGHPQPEAAIISVAAQAFFKAVGTGQRFVHVDTRTDKVRHWSYKRT